MCRFISRVAFCVATELVALMITDKIYEDYKKSKATDND